MADFITITVWIAIVSMVLCTTCIAIRVFIRIKYANQQLYLEDWLIVGPAYVSFMGIACSMIAATAYGLGAHIDQVSDEDLAKLFKILYAMYVPLMLTLAMIRTSILLFIQRLAKTACRHIYIITTGLIPFNIIHLTICMFVATFRCSPIRSLWDTSVLSETCLPEAVGVTLVAIGLAIDVALFVIPAILVFKLNIAKTKKLQSIFMFALGGGGCIVESLRFSQLHQVQIHPDITYTSAVVVVFLFFQVSLGMLCCCAPAMKMFFTTTFAKRLSYSRHRGTLHLGSYSGTADRAIHRAGSGVVNCGDDVESMQMTSPQGPSTCTSTSTLSPGWIHSINDVETNVTPSCSPGDGDDPKYKTMIVERIMGLEEVLKIDHTEAPSTVPRDNHTSDSARSINSQIFAGLHIEPSESSK